MRMSPALWIAATLAALWPAPRLQVAAESSWNFAAPVVHAVGAGPTRVFAADIDRDGKLDLATAGDGGVSLLYGRGDGTFESSALVAAGGAVSGIWIGDATGDGRPDLVLGRRDTAGFELHPGTAARAFGAPTLVAGPADIREIAPWNYLTTHRPAFAATSPEAPGFTILYRDQGAFTSFQFDDAAITAPVCVATGDLAGDGWPEVVVGRSSGIGGYLLSRETPVGITTFQSGRDVRGIAVADVNRDGRAEVLSVGTHGLEVMQGDFSSAIGSATYGGTGLGIALADFDGDGALDAAIVHDQGFALLRNSGAGSFGDPSLRATESDLRGVAVGDFDRDGRPDVAFAAHGGNGVEVRLNRIAWVAGGSFTLGPTYSCGNSGFEPAAGDLNKDGRIDLVTVDWGAGMLDAFWNSGDGTLQRAASWVAGSGTRSLALADLDANGLLDCVTGSCWGDGVDVQLGTAVGVFGPPTHFESGPWPYDARPGDVNRDGWLDLVVSHSDYSAEGYVGVLLGKGDGTFAAPITLRGGFNPTDAELGDFDGDGDLDIVLVSNSLGSTGTLSVFLGDGTGQFSAPADFVTGTASQGLAIGDFDRDGILDAAVANYGTSDVSCLRGRGDGSFDDAVSIPTAAGAGPVGLLACDLDRDGKLDLVVGDYAAPRLFVLPGHGDGTFGAARILEMPASLCYGVAADLFGEDGLPDLAFMGLDGNLHLLVNGVAAVCRVEADPADWGTVLAGDPASPQRSVAVRNTGTATLHVSGLSIVGTGFTLADGQPATFDVAPDMSANVAVVCTTSWVGQVGALLRVVSDDPASPEYDVSLSATAASHLCTPERGTLGSEILWRGPIGPKGSAKLVSGRKKVPLKVLEWTAGTPGRARLSVRAKKLAPKAWDLVLDPGRNAAVFKDRGAFTAAPPHLTSMAPTTAPAGGLVTFTGDLLGTRRGAILLVDPAGGRKKACAVKLWPVTAAEGDADGTIRVTVPKGLVPGREYRVRVQNGVGGSDYEVPFTPTTK